MKISLIEPLNVPKELIESLAAPIRERGHEFVYFDTKTTDPNELTKRSYDSDVVMIGNNPFPKEVICGCNKLKLINVAFTGVDHVALDECKARGILISNAAGYSNETVSELAIGMAISLLRNIIPCDKVIRQGGTMGGAGLMGTELCGKTVGIIGTGRIGLMTAKLFSAFGCKLLAYSRTEKQEAMDLNMKYVDIDTLLSKSDIISLHIPVTNETRGFLSAEKIAIMKKTAVLINCARGQVVDNYALANALNNGDIAGAAIDVFDMEPPIPTDYPLLNAKHTLLTPHVAFASAESMVRRANIAFGNTYAFIDGNATNLIKL